MSAIICQNCGATIPAKCLADEDGVRLFGCCACGHSSVVPARIIGIVGMDVPTSAFVPIPPGGGNWRVDVRTIDVPLSRG